jgi:hypothetical protein
MITFSLYSLGANNLLYLQTMKLIPFTIICMLLQWQSIQAQAWSLADYTMSNGNVELSSGLAGGLNAPQFHHIDMNRDGIDDLYVFDRDGFKSLIFEAVSDGNCVQYRYSHELSSYFPFLIEFVIPKDYNGDDIPDLFSYSQIGAAGMQLYKGIDKGDHLEFELVILDQNYINVIAHEFGSNISNVSVSRIDLPAIVDIDGDGDLDILTFPSSGGKITRFDNLQADRNLADDAIIFKIADNCWGGFYESDNSEAIFLSDAPGDCASPVGGGADTRHNGSTTLIWDPNRDGLPDALIGDFTSDNLVFLQNGGTPQTAWMTEQDFKFPSYDQSVEMATFLAAFNLDVDCDNKKDILVSPNITNGSLKTNNVLFYKNVGVFKDSFELISESFLAETMLDFGMKSAPAIVDLNADGWLDLVIGVRVDLINNVAPTGLVSLIHNGNASAPGFEVEDTDYLGLSAYAEGSGAFAPTFADMDSDGDMDIIIGDEEGYLLYGENTAGPDQPIQIPSLQYGWMNIDPGQFATPAVADINGDGLLDLIIGEQRTNNDVSTNMTCGNINYYQNIGTPTVPDFISNSETAPNTNCLGQINTKYPGSGDGLAAPAFYNTGDSLVLIIGSAAGVLARHTVAEADEPFNVVDAFVGEIYDGFFSMPALGDLNRDGILDIVVGNQRGGIGIYTSNIRTDGSMISGNRDVKLTDWKIYPNPVKSGSEIHLANATSRLNIKLYNLNGWELLSETIAHGQETIRLPGLTSGLYYLIISDGSSTAIQKLIVLN